MNTDIIDKLTAQVTELHFAENLPENLFGFTLQKIFAPDNDRFVFYTYSNEENHCALTVYFHTETMEFKVRRRIGLTEFCLTNFFTQDFTRFKEMIDANLETEIKILRDVMTPKANRFIDEKKIPKWTYGLNLPETLEGFRLFIKPSAPVEITNGSFIVIDYVDFAINSDFIIYFNIFGDEFSGESRVNGATHVTYDFDSKTLKYLEDKLKNKLADKLREIRSQAQ
ncbi:MAG: hypothetical protein K6G55_08225 [Selenomonadaceae bacterium]|nr:hypothetical protein [Selenomonadaceae bacterium]